MNEPESSDDGTAKDGGQNKPESSDEGTAKDGGQTRDAARTVPLEGESEDDRAHRDSGSDISDSEDDFIFSKFRAELSSSIGDDGNHRLSEHTSFVRVPEVPVTDGQLDGELESIRDALAPATAERGLGLIEVSKTFEDGSLALQLQTKNCGFTTVIDPKKKEERLLEVRPKLEETDWLRLLRLAVEQNGSPDEFFELDHRAKTTSDGHPAMLEVIAAMYRHALDGFFARGKGLRRLHRSRDETLTGRRRGKVRVRDYMSNIAGGRPLEVPCRHPSHELDNLPNRTLLTALRILLRATGRSDENALDGLDELHSLRDFRPRFGGVGEEPVEAADLTDLRRLPESFRHYRSLEGDDSERMGPLPLARWIIENFEFERESGTIRMPGMVFDMPSIFEEAFARKVEDWLGREQVTAQDRWTYHLEQHRFEDGTSTCVEEYDSRTKSYQPDLFVEGNEARRPLVLDTKWKHGISRDGKADEVIDIEELSAKPKNTDVNQISSYARLAARESKYDRSPVAALVYPCLGRMKSHWCVRWSLQSERMDTDHPEVYILGWNVSSDRETSDSAELEKQLKMLAKVDGQ